MNPVGDLPQLVEHARQPVGNCDNAPSSSPSCAGTVACAMRSSSPSETSRCWMPSCRSRSIRLRVSSAAATIRAREAISSARLSAFAIAVATSSVKLARRASVSAGSGWPTGE